MSVLDFFSQHSFNIQSKERVIEYLVSNKHVFDNKSCNIMFSTNLRKKDGLPNYEVPRKYSVDLSKSLYFEHPNPDIDLACFAILPDIRDKIYYFPVFSGFFQKIDYSKIASSSPVTFVGYPDGLYDQVNNLPIVRSGVIASAPDIDYQGKGQFLIDAAVMPGSSGSPVFAMQDNQFHLIGVLYACYYMDKTNNTSKIINIGDIRDSEPIYSQLLSLGVVIKQRHVIELIQYAFVNTLKLTKDNMVLDGADPDELETYIKDYKYPIEETIHSHNLIPRK